MGRYRLAIYSDGRFHLLIWGAIVIDVGDKKGLFQGNLLILFSY